ncbi:YL1_nuclear protein C-terminal domain-containing protein [Hexamita inflata]|uniref:YL1 nuclear protein C-terminal domain-containing protein n=1 Tax=Hexamita inflata TaxID=28002 RepID=A0AA86N7S4_9EUKA|nr:YL1 nuclear protein C-terminal domain-containing protein [Hexamita inflata]CAI9952251.1 YL1 nuclear protein C-terminal domain-containing protein [Hexamita inflata]
MSLSFQNNNFQSIAKIQQGQTLKLKFANIKSLLNDDEKRNNGVCEYRNMLEHESSKQQIQLCDCTLFPGYYTDSKTGLKYHDSVVFQSLHNLEKGQIMQLQDLHKFVKMDEIL